MRFFALIFLLIITSTMSHAKDLEVAFVRPGKADNFFWKRVSEIFEKAATDLNVKQKVFAAGDFTHEEGSDLIGYMKALDEAISSERDYLITYSVENETARLMRKTEKTKTKVFIVNSAISDSDRIKVGKPRTHFPHWIGHLYPDDEKTGYDLAKVLIGKSKKLGHKDVELIGLSGGKGSSPGLLRAEGLKRAMAEHPEVKLHSLHYFREWSPKRAAQKALDAVKGSNKTKIVWAASDAMAIKVNEVLGKLPKDQGKGIVVGGVDWLDEAIKKIESGELSASMGGHIMEAALALVLVYDHHKGIDFADSLGTTMKSKMLSVTPENVSKLKSNITLSSLKGTDFRSLSRAFNKKLKTPSIDLTSILTQQ
ncbi:MAG: ABC transporter substrate-binding protein [Pseudobacteriovorax sp.]|nr:ABC transporter substrate-binding protein [Pseudobacteriovorax sp.]